jgi:4-amino-4-deoxy-L-arabinose transferase-like glycosyltransferase
VIFKDTFTQYGALTALLQALAILVFGERIVSVLISTVFFYAASFTLLFLLAKRFLGRKGAFFAVFVALFLAPFYTWTFHPWSSVYSLFFLLLTLYTALLAAEGKRLWQGVLCGFFAALGFWCRQPVGLVTLLSLFLAFGLLAVLAARRGKDKRPYVRLSVGVAVGAVLGFFLFFLPLLALGAATDFTRQCLSGMATFVADRSATNEFGVFGIIGMLLYCLFIAPFVQWASPANYIWLLLPLSSLFLFFRQIKRLRKSDAPREPDVALLLLSVFSCASWHQYYPVSCYRHWYWAAFPSVLSLLILLAELYKKPPQKLEKYVQTKKQRLLAAALALLLVFGPNVGWRAVAGGIKLAENKERVRYLHETYTHFNGLYLDKDVASYYTQLLDTVSYLETTFPDKNIVNTTENGVFALFGENFCPIFNNSGDFYYAEYPALQDDYIKTARPIVIGPTAPLDDYVLYATLTGDPADPYAEYHRMPANVYLPAELYAQAVP